jgi:hypothetical protein
MVAVSARALLSGFGSQALAQADALCDAYFGEAKVHTHRAGLAVGHSTEKAFKQS